ncbi:MAG: 6-hydroxymethylpterin diphosphokinase MptE-like protein [Halanaeroarchaeum sp.]
MEFHEWEPIYERIRDDFGYDRRADASARDALASFAEPFDLDRLAVRGRSVAIAGGAATLRDERGVAAETPHVFAASTATDVLDGAAIDVDVMVTDLDKNPETAVRRTREGRPVAVHAHGDNVPQIRQYVPTFSDEHVLPTTQVEPRGPVENFGGFTDGDRGAFLADEFGAAELLFPGWDFDDPSVGTAKRAKLEWAERLLYWLELRRDDRFDVLDGRRDAIELPF